MRRNLRTYFSTLIIFSAITVFFANGTRQSIHAGGQIQDKNELFFKVAGHVLNTEAETGTSPGYSINKTTPGTYSVKDRHEVFLLPTYISNISKGIDILPSTRGGEAVQHFIPLFRFLIYPKHWFW